MATEKQIAANRANAKRSTGPRTEPGRSKSSRNAFRHGLSCPLQSERVAPEELANVVQALSKGADAESLTAAGDFLQSQQQLSRIRDLRAKMIAAIEFTNPDPWKLSRVVPLDRYERYAQTRRRRALRKLES